MRGQFQHTRVDELLIRTLKTRVIKYTVIHTFYDLRNGPRVHVHIDARYQTESPGAETRIIDARSRCSPRRHEIQK